jgi:hypothetical protein
MKRENLLFISATLFVCTNFLMPSITATASHAARQEANALRAGEQVPARTPLPHRGHAPVVPTEMLQQRSCVVECEPNEGEETCYDGYVDDYNGGCYSDPPVFQPIECGQTICGTSGVYVCDGSTCRDMDWFEVTLDTSAQITWAGEAEFPVAMWILSGDCNDIIVEEYATAAECTPLSLSHACGAGRYMLVIAPADWGDYACGARYEATVTCEAFFGVCCYGYNGSECAETTESECYDVLNGDWYFGETCDTFSCDWSCEEAQLDIAIMTDQYPTETTWEVTDHATGVVLGMGGPYDDAHTLYFEGLCIDYDDCVDFTIYDAYGDGIYSPGGYTIWLDDEVIHDCMGDGWYGDDETVEYIGKGCVWPEGACCVCNPDTEMYECVATNTEPECDDLGGSFYEGQDCFGDPPFECPETDADFLVTAPFTSEILNSCGAGDDCDLRSTEEYEFEVIIPWADVWHFNTCLNWSSDTYMYLGTELCTSDLGYNDDSCGLQSEIITWLEAGNYFCTVEGYGGCGEFVFDVRWYYPGCFIYCPDDASEESEPCGGFTNDGCEMSEPQFEPIACYETICGTAWQFGGWRDTDWYEFVATNDDTMTFELQAEFYVLFGLVEQVVPGEPGCDNMTGYLDPYELTADCNPASISFPVTAGGTYYVFVAPQFYGWPVDCDSEYIDYIATLTGENCICGDFDNDGDVDVDDFYVFLDAFGTCAGDAAYEEDCDFDGDECITLVDYQMWTQCYRDANRGEFVAPTSGDNTAHRPGSRMNAARP